jgi:hypothetical protein
VSNALTNFAHYLSAAKFIGQSASCVEGKNGMRLKGGGGGSALFVVALRCITF